MTGNVRAIEKACPLLAGVNWVEQLAEIGPLFGKRSKYSGLLEASDADDAPGRKGISLTAWICESLELITRAHTMELKQRFEDLRFLRELEKQLNLNTHLRQDDATDYWGMLESAVDNVLMKPATPLSLLDDSE